MWTFVWFSLGPPSTEEPHSVFEMPSSAVGRCVFVVSIPIKVLLYLTVPDCRRARWRKWVIVTFILSLVWLSLFSYLMVWMITIIGKDLSLLSVCLCLSLTACLTSCLSLSSLCLFLLYSLSLCLFVCLSLSQSICSHFSLVFLLSLSLSLKYQQSCKLLIYRYLNIYFVCDLVLECWFILITRNVEISELTYSLSSMLIFFFALNWIFKLTSDNNLKFWKIDCVVIYRLHITYTRHNNGPDLCCLWGQSTRRDIQSHSRQRR